MKLFWKILFGVIIFIFLIWIFSYFNFTIVRNNSSVQETVSKEEITRNLNVPKNSYLSVFPAISLLYGSEPQFNPENLQNSKDKKIYDRNLREKIGELLKKPLKPLKNPDFEILKEEDKGKYVQKKVRLYTSDLTLSYLYLLIPKEISSPAPAIIAMHQHGDIYDYGKAEVVGEEGNPDLFYGKELAERGYIVLAMDSPLFGDRMDRVDRLNRTSQKNLEEISTQNLLAFGFSPLGIMLQEDQISLDYLSSLDIVDKNNIGCIGHSMGGIRCLYLSATDERIKTTVISGAIANLRLSLDIDILQTWFILAPGLARYTETSGILALIAPRPMMIIYTEKDPIFPLNEAKEHIDIIKRLYGRLKQEENFESIFIPNTEHEFPKKYHEQAYQFLDKNLKNNS